MLVSLQPETLTALQNKKNLLAFSSGSDSSALFHLLLQLRIEFDIIHVNYNTRRQSDAEETHAHMLAAQHHKYCFSKQVTLKASDLEHQARTLRYAFFHETILQHGYDNLITAHQLNDRLEWLLMQLCKGAGLYELIGMEQIEPREHYTLLRPLLHVNSDTITQYLKHHNIEHFIDESNHDTTFERNFVRKHYATPLLQNHANGIAKSFEYLEEDIAALVHKSDFFHVNQLSYFKLPPNRRSTLIAIDTLLKMRGCVMSSNEKNLLKSLNTLVVSRNYVVTIGDQYCFVAPYITTVMSKSFKEQCRRLHIEPKLRGYLYSDAESFACTCSLLM